jgi:signal transduction histidine kinase/ActR/RegA family two-component response regulator
VSDSSTALRILHLDDSPIDRDLAAGVLKSHNVDCTITPVADREAFEAALRSQTFDIIISDFNMPGFDGATACAISQKVSPDTPFIFLSGTVGEERAVLLLQQGATDYVLKDRMARLGSAVKRAREAHQMKTARLHAEDELRQLNVMLEQRIDERTAELAAARQEADRANRAKSEFLSRMSHELRTPLNAVLGFAQMLDLEEPRSDQRDSIRHIVAGGRHLLDLINEVLDIARIESGHLSVSLEPVALESVLAQAVELIGPLAAQRSITITPHQVGKELAVVADRQRLNQIVLNLLSNAVKYNRAHGTITITTQRPSPNRCRIVVSDTGAGIPPAKIELLFQPFQRLGAEHTNVEGTGLGLMLSSALAQMMGGQIGVNSVVDQGSAFWVELAVASAQERIAPVDPLDRASASRPTKGTILYIEDNVANVRLMERVMRQRPGLELLHASLGADGLRMLQTTHVDLVFLDMHLPDMSGDDVMRKIWESPETRKIPVVVLTADASPAVARRITAAGAAGCLAKPFNIPRLLATIDERLGAQ